MGAGADLIRSSRGHCPSLVTNPYYVLEVVNALNFVLAQVLDDYTFGWILHNMQVLALILASAQ